MTEKFVFIGQAPGRRRNGDTPLEGSAVKMGEIIGIEPKQFLRFKRLNVLDEFPGKKGKGDDFDFARAMESATRIEQKFEEGFKVVFMGKNVSKAFKRIHMEYGDEAVFGIGSRCFLFPHLSGINRFWNDKKKAKHVSEKLRKFLFTS